MRLQTTTIVLIALMLSLSAACSETETNQVEGTDGNNLRDTFDTTPASVNNGSEEDFEFPETDPETWPERPESVLVPEPGAFVFRDRQTGSWWNMRGEAYRGPMTGMQLEQIPAFNAFWFAWSTFWHGSEVWNRDVTNLPGEIEAAGECEVPCSEIFQGCGGGRDCIPALDWDGENDRPVAEMVAVDSPKADYLADDDFVLGVVIDGEARAYPHNILWWHEIYNDQIGERPFSVTFCPLTGSGIVFDGEFGGSEIDFEVSGNLYNANLVMVDRASETLWSQMLLQGITGPNAGSALATLPVTETTWEKWRTLYPDTLVASDEQGYSRNYDSYPYGDYRTNDSDTFTATNPDYEDFYEAKDRVLGIYDGEASKAYAVPELEAVGDRVIVNDTFDGEKIVVVFEAEHRHMVPFRSTVDGEALTFSGATAE